MIDILISYLLLSASIAMFLVIWFNNTFVEYMNLLRLTKFFYIEEYNNITVDDPSLSYLEYLAANRSNFLVKIISCPKCIVVWLSILLHIPIIVFIDFPLIFIPVSIFIAAYFSLLMYYILVKLMNK
jgi:hypothetical protein